MVVLIYLDSPYSLINKDYVGVTSIPNEVLQAEATAEEAEAVTSDSDMVEGERTPVKMKTKNLYPTIH